MKPTTGDLKKLLVEIAPDLEDQDIKSDANLVNELDIDSMDFLDFIVKIAKSYGVDIPESDYSMLGTLDACVEYIAARSKQN